MMEIHTVPTCGPGLRCAGPVGGSVVHGTRPNYLCWRRDATGRTDGISASMRGHSGPGAVLTEIRDCDATRERFARCGPNASPGLRGSFLRRRPPYLIGQLLYLLEPLLELLGRIRVPERPRQV